MDVAAISFFEGRHPGSMNAINAEKLTTALLPAVLDAARIEMAYFQSGGFVVESKADKSLVTVADREAEAVITAALARFAPEIPVVGEEAATAGHVPELRERFFLVDALDGTSGFVKGKPEFTINIGLVSGGTPVFGLIFVPPTGDLYVTGAGGALTATLALDNGTAGVSGPDYKRIYSREPDPDNLIAFNSRTAGGAGAEFLSRLGVKDMNPMGSSRKFCLIAEGKGDVYVRFGRTCEWDTAAGHAILEAAGGTMTARDGAALVYGKVAEGFANPHFVAWGRAPLLTEAARAPD